MVILLTLLTFYSNLFTDDHCDINFQNDFVNNITTSLSNGDISLCKSPLTLEDLHVALNMLNKMESNKSRF